MGRYHEWNSTVLTRSVSGENKQLETGITPILVFIPYGLGFLKKILFIFRDGEKREKERERNLMCERNIDQLSLACPQMGTWPAVQASALTSSPTRYLQFAGQHSIH